MQHPARRGQRFDTAAGQVRYHCAIGGSRALQTPAPTLRFAQISRTSSAAHTQKEHPMDIGALGQFLPLILIFAIMYFLLIRPQQKKAKEHRAMVDAVRRGDQVITQGGLIGKVVKVKEEGEIEAELAEGVKVRVVKSTIATVMSKTEPAK
jgi:preprotein translocase subunit YajC